MRESPFVEAWRAAVADGQTVDGYEEWVSPLCEEWKQALLPMKRCLDLSSGRLRRKGKGKYRRLPPCRS
jgi:hypothetical protein